MEPGERNQYSVAAKPLTRVSDSAPAMSVRKSLLPCAGPYLRLDGSGDRAMPEQRSGWCREFDEPIAVPDSGKLVTLRDAADYITALPDEEAALPEWQAAIEALMLVADLGGPTMFARIGMMRALSRACPRAYFSLL